MIFDTQAADRSTSRIINRTALIDLIYKCDGISKAQLAAVLGLSKPAVSKNVDDLMAMGLVEERGTSESGEKGGRRPTMLHFNSGFGYVGAVDLSLQRPICAIGDMNHNMLCQNVAKVHRNASAAEKCECILQTFKNMLAELSIPANKLEVLVISHPGIIDANNEAHYTGERHHAWTNIGLKQFLEQTLSIPIVLNSNVTLASIGEMVLGFGEQFTDLIYIDCGVGLGAGVIIDGKPYEGRNRAAAGIWAVLLDDGQTVEEVAALNGLIKRIEQLFAKNGQPHEELDFEKIVEFSRQGNPLVNESIREIGLTLGRIIYNTSVIFDVQSVVFGGEYLQLGNILLDAMEETLAQSIPFPITLQKSRLLDMAGLYGGFVVGRDMILQKSLSTLT